MLNFKGILLSISLIAFCFGENKTDSKKIDSILTLSKEIREEVRIISPIADKTFGIEINPVLPLIAAGEGFVLTGGLQLFNLNRKAEVSFPFQIFLVDNADQFTLDAHFRHFLGQTQYGFYLSGFTRYGYLSGDYITDGWDTKYFENHRLGIGAGLGYRIYSRGSFYWGCSLNLGRYVIFKEPEDELFSIFGISSFSQTIIDIELFKFGFAF
jgi:hypothetical protein